MPSITEFNESRWLFGGGISPEWTITKLDRISKSLARLKIIEESIRRRKITAISKQYLNGIKKFISSESPLRNLLVTHPCFDYWLYLWNLCPEEPSAKRYLMMLGIFQGFVAPLEMEQDRGFEISVSTDPNGRFYFYGTQYYLQLPGNAFPIEFKIRLQNGHALLAIENEKRFSTPLSRVPEIIPGICADSRNWLLTGGIAKQEIVKLEGNYEDKFIFTLKSALADIEKKEPLLYSEMRELLRALIPLATPSSDTSVSSSYTNLRGAVALSHSDDILIQAETLIHEYCHQKINQLSPIEPLLQPGQSSRIFYSPWRPDARHLRGILLGTHAFLNVARYLTKTLKADILTQERRFRTMSMLARRVFQMQDALQTLSYYGSFTEFGRRFLLGCWKELGILRQGIEYYPSSILKEQKRYCANHRKAYALPGLGLHKGTPRENAGKPVRR